ncbi:MAG TPA: DUF2306 domain-containing protein [Hyphomonadaceae bacterium]|nr:DUF2306 domain-containing protein [Hyphomonadaceae bacterium]
MTVAKLGGGIAWTVIMLLSVGVGGYALFLVATGFQFLGLKNPMFDPWGLQVHIAASGVAMITGAFQFFKPLRQKLPAVHRWLGRIYVAACTIGGLAGGTIALSTTAGPIAGWGFFLLAILWVPFTLLALASAMRKDFVSHERWMIRSFALTFAAVTLRIYLPLAIIQAHGDFPLDAYRAIAWLAWVPNLIVAELFIATLRKPKKRAMAPAAA